MEIGEQSERVSVKQPFGCMFRSTAGRRLGPWGSSRKACFYLGVSCVKHAFILLYIFYVSLTKKKITVRINLLLTIFL